MRSGRPGVARGGRRAAGCGHWGTMVAPARPHGQRLYLVHAGVSPDVIAAWLSRIDASFTMRTYVHARPEDLAVARDAPAARKLTVSHERRAESEACNQRAKLT
jgi:hypothetical protein